MTREQRQQLDEQGWVVLDSGMGALRDPLRERILALFAEEGDRAGSEFRTEERARRLANLVEKTPSSAAPSCFPRCSRACAMFSDRESN